MEGWDLESVLCLITERFNEQNITWALGASAMLKLRGFAVEPHDLDLLVDERSLTPSLAVLSRLGHEQDVLPKPPYHTQHFHSFIAGGMHIDLLCHFSIEHEMGVYRHRFDSSCLQYARTRNVQVPLSALEEWFVLYLLMPGRGAKADLIEQHLRQHGLAHPQVLHKTLLENLPSQVQQRIERLLEATNER